MKARRPPLSPTAAGLALGQRYVPVERRAVLLHAELTRWFAGQPARVVRAYTARVAPPASAPEGAWRLAQVVLDADDAIVDARWIEAEEVDALVGLLHAHDSFVWWQE
jgi:hypothetical protein